MMILNLIDREKPLLIARVCNEPMVCNVNRTAPFSLSCYRWLSKKASCVLDLLKFFGYHTLWNSMPATHGGISRLRYQCACVCVRMHVKCLYWWLLRRRKPHSPLTTVNGTFCLFRSGHNTHSNSASVRHKQRERISLHTIVDRRAGMCGHCVLEYYGKAFMKESNWNKNSGIFESRIWDLTQVWRIIVSDSALMYFWYSSSWFRYSNLFHISIIFYYIWSEYMFSVKLMLESSRDTLHTCSGHV